MRFEHQNIHFTSDFHVGHTNILKFDKRPFQDVNEMHQTLIQNWNECVNENDIVFYLGDFSYRDNSLAKWFRDQLNGKIYFICGNHDRVRDISKLGFERIYEYGTEISIEDKDLKKGFQDIVLCHYPILSWNKSHYGSWHLHGHCHQSIAKNPDMEWYYKRKVIDMGANGHEYRPLSYLDIKQIMSTKIISAVDHHSEK